MSSHKKYKSPVKKYQRNNFDKAKLFHPSPSPKRSDFESKAAMKPTNEKCLYIDPDTNKRCKNEIGIYPEFCSFHTLLIDNLYISPSKISGAGNGLFSGPEGFEKGDIIAEYSNPQTRLTKGQLVKRNGNCKKYNDSYTYGVTKYLKKNYVDDDIVCYDNLDHRSSISRNANSAHGSKYRNNATFDEIKEKDGEIHVYIIATKSITPYSEIFVDYGSKYEYI